MKSAGAALMMAAAILISQPAWAQDEPAETRPATPTFWGDTGLWFVPTAETPRSGGMTFSLYRSEFNYSQGFTNVSYWPITASVGIGDRVEVFGAIRLITRIDRDVRPLFFAEPRDGGLVNEYPFVQEPWTGNDIGDLFVGGKLNLASQSRNQTLGLALRGTVKFPTAHARKGSGTGEIDGFADAIVSKEIGGIELTGFGGVVFRTDPDEVSLADSLRWGVGAGFGSRGRLRLTTELWGQQPFDDAVQLKMPLGPASDGSIIPVMSPIDSAINTSVGLTVLASGLSLGMGMTYHIDLDRRSDFSSNENVTGDVVSLQFRLGFHSGVKTYRAPVVEPPAPPPPPAPAPAPIVAAPAPAPAVNRQPIVLVVCDPCQVEVGRTLALRATAQDADGDQLRFRWTVPGGVIADPAAASTNWTAQATPGPVVLTLTVDDGRGGTATGQVNVQVVAAAQVLAFDDIVFEFNRDLLPPAALNTLQTIVAALNANPALSLQIEGHASEEGTAEYNLALGERRATAVQTYLVSQGISAARLSTVTYGEERPRFDNTSDANRALNRRASFVIRGQ
jgi:outer membrane protein OmpA-like peptidoglycan-associated protein